MPIEFPSRVIGHGLLAAEMGEQKAQEKAVWSAFQGHVVRELVPDMWCKSIGFANVIAREMGQSSCMVESRDIVSRATVDKLSFKSPEKRDTVQGGCSHPMAYMPFLYGPRACIGQVFTKAEMKSLLPLL